jgi:hypothetical protein
LRVDAGPIALEQAGAAGVAVAYAINASEPARAHLTAGSAVLWVALDLGAAVRAEKLPLFTRVNHDDAGATSQDERDGSEKG